MKKTIYRTLWCLLPAMMLGMAVSSCGDDKWQPNLEENGQLDLSSIQVDVAKDIPLKPAKEQTLPTRSEINTGDFIVDILDAKGKIYKSFPKASEMPEVLTLVAGDYKLKVRSHDIQPAEFDKPYYLAERDFSIKPMDVTAIGVVTCKFASIKVTIAFGDKLKSYMDENCKVTVVASAGGSLVFGRDETRAGYFKALEGSSTLVATFEGKINGTDATATVNLSDVEAGTHRMIIFRLPGGITQPGGTINPSNGITLDTSVIEEEGNGTIDPGDEILDGDDRPGQGGDDPGTGDDPNPGQNDISFESEFLDFEKPMNPDPFDIGAYGENAKPAVVVIKAPNGLSNLIVNIESTSQEFIGVLDEMKMPTTFDLANPDGNEELFGGFKFPYGADVVGAKEVTFDISEFVGLLKIYTGTHKFTITAKDKAGKSLSKSLTFVWNGSN